MKNQNFGAPPREVILVLEQSKSLSTFSHNIHLSEEAKSFLNKVVEGTWTQRSDGKIDVDGSVYADGNEEIQNFLGKEIFFGDVTGSFFCAHTNITSLKGAPEKVGGSFYCYYTPYEAGLKKQEQEKHEKEVSPSDRVLSNTPVSLNQLIKEVKELLKQAQEENNEEIDRVYSKYFGDCSINLSENKEILRDHEEAVNAALNKFINFLKKHGIKTVELGDSEVVDNSGLGGYGSNYDPGDTINQGFQPHTVCFEILNLPEDLIAKILSADFYKEGDEGNIIFDVRKEDNILMIDVGAASLEVEIGDEQEDEDEDEEDEDEY